jgi:hypothetical protein
MKNYNAKDAEGFINLTALPIIFPAIAPTAEQTPQPEAPVAVATKGSKA